MIMSTKLPAPASRLRPPSRLQLPSVVTPVSKRRASEENLLPEQNPSKRSKKLANSSSSSSLSSNEDASTNVSVLMGPPTTITTSRKLMPGAARNKLRRSVSMASIPVGGGIRRAAAAAAVAGVLNGGGLSRSNSKLSGSVTNITGRPSNVATKAPVGTSFPRRPGTNITNRINNTSGRPPPAAAAVNAEARKPPTSSNGSASVTPLEKVRSKRPAWDTKGRLQDMEEVVFKLQSTLQTLHQENHSLDTHLTETTTVKEAKQEELDRVYKQLRELQQSSSSSITTLTSRVEQLELSLEQRERNVKELRLELDLKLEEMVALKRSLSEATTSRSTLEAQVCSTQSQLTESTAHIADLTRQLTEALNSVVDLKEKVLHGEELRKKLHDRVQELKGNIRVFCRVRPLLGEEVALNGDSDVVHHLSVISENTLEMLKGAANCDNSSMSGLKTRGNGAIEFSYDRVFGPKDSQSDVFEEVSQLVQSALDGFNVCVFAYGQTGSGKTYTMEGGDGEEQGIIPRTVGHIFVEVKRMEEHGWRYSIETSILEIYNETIRDLLAPPTEARNLSYDIKMTDSRSPHIHVTNLKVVPVLDASDIYSLLDTARRHRAVAATNMNLHSSRSHCVFRMVMRGSNARTGQTCEGSLSLVDLAGSERLKESGSTGARLTETQAINKSLSSLGNVIMAMGQKQPHIPYRNSKLTHLLQPCLGGNSKTLMLVNVSPVEASANETLNSLRFATKVNACHVGVASRQAKKN